MLWDYLKFTYLKIKRIIMVLVIKITSERISFRDCFISSWAKDWLGDLGNVLTISFKKKFIVGCWYWKLGDSLCSLWNLILIFLWKFYYVWLFCQLACFHRMNGLCYSVLKSIDLRYHSEKNRHALYKLGLMKLLHQATDIVNLNYSMLPLSSTMQSLSGTLKYSSLLYMIMIYE